MTSVGDSRHFQRIASASAKSIGRTVNAFIPDKVIDLSQKIAKMRADAQQEKELAEWKKINDALRVSKNKDAALKEELLSLVEKKEDITEDIELLKDNVRELSTVVPRTNRPSSGKPSARALARASSASASSASARIPIEINKTLTKIEKKAEAIGRLNTKIGEIIKKSTLSDKIEAEEAIKRKDVLSRMGQTRTQRVLNDPELKSRTGFVGGVKRKVYKSTKRPVVKRPLKKPTAVRAKRPVAKRPVRAKRA
jgi:hypothetical protein